MTTPQRPRLSNSRGFTMIEALIAMAVMGIILAALATITSQWLPNWNRGMKRVQRDEHIALGLERIIADIAAAEFVSPNAKTKAPLFIGSENSVVFVRSSVVPTTGPGLQFVRIADVSSDDGHYLVRTQTPFTPTADEIDNRNPLNFADPVVLLKPPYRIAFSFAGSDRIWRSAWQNQPLLPKAVKVIVQDPSTQTALALSSTALVHAEVPVECITVKSLVDCLKRLQPAAPVDSAKSPS